MNRFIICIAAALAWLAAPAASQDSCPRTKAQTIGYSVTFHGVIDCGSVRIRIGDTEFSGPNQGCPLLAVETPQHEREVAQTNGNRTMVDVYAQVAVRVHHYTCDQDWLLFIPWGSACALLRTTNGAALPRMTTVPCAPLAP